MVKKLLKKLEKMGINTRNGYEKRNCDQRNVETCVF